MDNCATAQLRRFRLRESTPSETDNLAGSREAVAAMLVSAFHGGSDERYTLAFPGELSHRDQQSFTESVLEALTARPSTRGPFTLQDEPLYYPGPRVRVSGPTRPHFVLRDELDGHVLGMFSDASTFVLAALRCHGPGVDWLSLASERPLTEERHQPEGHPQEAGFGELVPGLFYEYHHIVGAGDVFEVYPAPVGPVKRSDCVIRFVHELDLGGLENELLEVLVTALDTAETRSVAFETRLFAGEPPIPGSLVSSHRYVISLPQEVFAALRSRFDRIPDQMERARIAELASLLTVSR